MRPSPVVACGVVQLVALAAVSRLDARVETVAFLVLVGVASAGYLAALTLLARGRTLSSRELAVCVALGVVWRVALVGAAPIASDDVYRYVWDGRVQHLGHNPYLAVPDDPALASLHTDLTRRIDPTSAALPTIYPPATQLLFRVVTAIDESVTAIVVVVLVCDLLTMIVMWRWLAATGRRSWWLLVYAWHPLIAIEGAASGHVDLVGTLFVLLAAYALHTRLGLLASLALAVATAVKFLPLVLAPLLWRRVRPWHALAGLGVILLFYLPYVDRSQLLPVGSLGTYAAQWRFNGPLFALGHSLVGLVPAVAVTVASGLVVAVIAGRRWSQDAPESWALPMATTLVLMPAIYPWYLVWLVPFCLSRSTVPVLVWSIAVFLTYAVWIAEASGAGWVLPWWVQLVEYGLLALSTGWMLARPQRTGSFAA